MAGVFALLGFLLRDRQNFSPREDLHSVQSVLQSSFRLTAQQPQTAEAPPADSDFITHKNIAPSAVNQPKSPAKVAGASAANVQENPEPENFPEHSAETSLSNGAEKPSSQPSDNILSAYKKTVLTRIAEKKVYPFGARLKQMEGEAQLFLQIGRSGKVLVLKLLQSSGVDLLDKAALKAVRRSAPFPPLPDGDALFECKFFIEFRLEDI
ncbi:MAG: TonB family protein [Spirochaetota bacterium]